MEFIEVFYIYFSTNLSPQPVHIIVQFLMKLKKLSSIDGTVTCFN